jgi:hypothetical protein
MLLSLDPLAVPHVTQERHRLWLEPPPLPHVCHALADLIPPLEPPVVAHVHRGHPVLQERLLLWLVRLCAETVNEWGERLAMTRISSLVMAAPPRVQLKTGISVAEAGVLLKTLALSALQAFTALVVFPKPVLQGHGLPVGRRPAAAIYAGTDFTV